MLVHARWDSAPVTPTTVASRRCRAMFEYDGHRLFASNGRHVGRDIVERQASNSTDIERVTSIAVDAPTSLVVLKPLKENR